MNLLRVYGSIVLKTELYREAVALWGIDAQLTMLIEECSELTKAICKFKRKRDKVTQERMVGEAVDVSLMIEQIRFMFLVDSKLWSDLKRRKLLRLKAMIDYAKKHNI